MNRKKWLQKIATFMLAGTLILQPVSLSSMNLMSLTAAAAEAGEQGEGAKEEEKKTPDEKKSSEEKNSAAGKDTDNKKPDDSGQGGESARKTESDSAGQKNEDKEQSSSSDVKKEEKEKKEGEEKESGTENKEEAEKKEETEKEKEEKQKDKDEKKEEKEDKKEDKEEKEKNAGEKKTEENDPAVDAENAAKAAGQDHKKEENKEEEENQNSDKAEKAADDGKTGENTTDAAESQNAQERLGETLEKTILQAPVLKANDNQGKKNLIIYITAKNMEIPYDGKEHIVQQYEVKYKVGDGDATETAPEGVSVKLKPNKIQKGINAKTYDFELGNDSFIFNVPNDVYKFNQGKSIIIRPAEGYLKIAQAECSVTITGNTASLPYNGKEQSVSGYTIELPKGAPIGKGDIRGPEQSDAVAKGTDANGGTNADKTYPMRLQASAFSYKGNEENCKVTFQVTDGWLKIKPLGITLITGSESKEYDGTPLTLDLLSPQLINEEPGADLNTFFGEAEPVTVTGSRTDVGSSDNTCQITWKDGATPDNYNIKYNLGKLVVTPKHVTITAKDASKEYDGSALTESGITVEGLADTDTHTFKVEMTSDSAITNPGTKSNVIGTVDGVAVEPGKETAVGNYLVTVKNGTLTITGDGPKPTPTGDDDPKPSAQKDENQTPGDDNPPRDGGDNTGSGTGNAGNGTDGTENNGGGTGNGGNTNAGGGTAGRGTTGGGNNGGTNTGGGNGAAAANAAAAPAAAPVAPAVTPAPTPAAPAVTEIPDNQVPQAAPEEVTIDDEPAPQAAPEEPAVDEEKAAPQEAPVYWALLNLLMAIGSVLLGAGMLAAYFADRDRTDGAKNEEEDLSGEERKRRGVYRLACAVPAAASLIVFFLTEDLSRQMRMADKWTPLMVVFLAATAALAFLSGRNKEAESEEV